MCGTCGKVQGKGSEAYPPAGTGCEPHTRARPPVVTHPAPSSMVEAVNHTDVAAMWRLSGKGATLRVEAAEDG